MLPPARRPALAALCPAFATLALLLALALPAGAGEMVRERVVLERVESPELDRPVPVYIYLPPGYGGATDRRYPVVYMHDGAEAFENGRRLQELPPLPAGIEPLTWNVGQVLDGVFERAPERATIVVAIDTDARVEHFSPWPWSPAHAARGRAYMDFIARTLKPWVDHHYPTEPGREHTAMLGSSFGGIITLYGVVKYPDVFSKAAILSPVFTDGVLGQELNRYITLRGPLQEVRIWMDVGSTEAPVMQAGLMRVEMSLLDRGFWPENVHAEIAPGGTHFISSWRERFPAALAWLFGW